ncbi:MAG: uracil phosphoribosyltransferase [Candidatus Kariarchaeaceae archaeon]|jgi:uracil phosphoribosyltransferase
MKIEFKESSVLIEALTAIRDKNTSAPKFRSNLKRIGTYLAYEAAKDFITKKYSIETPITKMLADKIEHEIVIISILRAALPMVDGVLDQFENASIGIISASRGDMVDEQGTEFIINSSYTNLPSLKNKIAIIVDPMLATGSTIKFVLQLMENESPNKIVLISAIASKFGVKAIEDFNPEVSIYVGATDPSLNERGYIVPGLGDAGDRAFNTNHE